ncbi:hypothetical protein GCM10027271_32480 [Saccharopolyspora gloriosae]|uniref:Tetratricopeptide (TPR) repeat protein n=1 Tax=Saccharopolyspora gloriosae TaxID=455344 RepID=A0A840NC37_9PSEU|nr:hypothetical protein [Saccharopolyspora gloriosae]MBB5069856.1 tetratricopeptide (TPR) repeat protein [Saccharopolyspora gloriosae]
MRSVFDVSYQELPAQARELYRRLGLHPGPELHVTAASAAAGWNGTALREPLDALLGANLLQEVRADRFRFHDLIRAHAAERAAAECTAEQRRDVVVRIVEHYLRRARAAAELCAPRLPVAAYDFTHPAPDSADFTGPREALDWLETERANLVGGVRAAVGHRLPATAWQLGHALWPLFRYGGHHADWRTVDELCLTAARELDAPEREASTARRLAALHHRRGAWAESARLLERCGELCAATGDAFGSTDAHDARAVLALAQGDPATARACALRAEAGFRELGFPREAALALLLAGQAEASAGDGLDHVRVAESRLREFRDVDPFNAARARIALGTALLAAGALAEASTALDDGAAAMTELGSATGQALAHRGLADLAAARRDPTTERLHLTEAVRLFDHHGDAAAGPLRDRLGDLTGPA